MGGKRAKSKPAAAVAQRKSRRKTKQGKPSRAAAAARQPAEEPPSLTSLPLAWLHRLAKCHLWKLFDIWAPAGHEHRVALLRTCRALRDAVLDAHTLHVGIGVPTQPDMFASTLEMVCTAQRRSRNVFLGVVGPEIPDYQRATAWARVEVSAAHLLACAKAELGGAPLTNVRTVLLHNMELESVVPRWLPTVCPNVTHLIVHQCDLRPEPCSATPPRAAPAPPAPAPAATRLLTRLEHVDWQGGECSWSHAREGRELGHVRRQLAALPALGKLSTDSWPTDVPFDVPASATLTELRVCGRARAAGAGEAAGGSLRALATHFPRLAALHLPRTELGDAQFEQLLLLPALTRLECRALCLERAHGEARGGRLAWLGVRAVGVDSLARLPPGALQGLRGADMHDRSLRLLASEAPAAVHEVLAEMQRWPLDGKGAAGGPRFRSVELDCSGCGPGALAANLPLLAALRRAPMDDVGVVGAEDVTVEALQELGQAVRCGSLGVLKLTACSLAADAWAALLPSVAGLWLLLLRWPDGCAAPAPTEEQLVDMCRHAHVDVSLELVGKVPGGADELCRRVLRRAGNTHVKKMIWIEDVEDEEDVDEDDEDEDVDWDEVEVGQW